MALLTVLQVAGIANVLFLLLISLSCRCMGMHNLTKGLFSNEWYMKFYNMHCYFWYLLYASVFIHAAIAIYLFGVPFIK